MSHPAFTGLTSGDATRRRGRSVGSSSMSNWQSSLGISPTISAWNLASFLLHSTSSILFLVFLNATQPFLISQLGETKKQGSLSGTLVFSDELLSMFLVLFWGSLADVAGTKIVAVSGYCFIAIALFSYTWAQKPWPDLLFCRLTFAIGGSAVTAMLSGILNSYSASQYELDNQESTDEEEEGGDGIPTESTSLLPRRSTSKSKRKSRHGRLAALTGIMTGLGALIAVFFLLRLPTLLASLHDRNAPPDLPDDGGDEAVRRGTLEAFYIVAMLSVLVALTLSFGLKMDKPSLEDGKSSRRPRQDTGTTAVEEEGSSTSNAAANPRQARRHRLKSRLEARASAGKRLQSNARTLLSGIFSGFRLAGKDSSLSLAYLSGGLARACTIATTVFIPLLVTRFYYTSGLCSTLPSPDVPPSELKRTCRQAFTVASILSGVIQLIALLLSPVIAWMCEVLSPAWTLLISTTIGTISFLVIALALPNDGDPRSPIAWVAAIGIGFCQIAAIVASLALCAKAKSDSAAARRKVLTSFERPDGNQNVNDESLYAAKEVTSLGGSIAGAYSATGGLFILLISKLGGSLSDLYAPAAFLLLAFMAASTAILALSVVWQERRRSTPTSTSS